MSNDYEARKAQTKTLFNSVSPDYDSGPGCFAHFGRRLVEVAGINAGARVLDIASGRGAVLFPVAERVGAGGEVVGIDLADAMAHATSEEAASRGLKARVHVMDAEALTFPDASFDCVTCGFGIMFFPNQDRGLMQMRRVLKSGGCLALSTWRVAQGDDLHPVLNAIGIPPSRTPGWITEPDMLEALIRRNGFTGISVKIDAMDFRYADAEEVWQQGRGTGMRRILDTLDATQKKRALSLLTERMQPHRRHDGYYLRTTALLAVANR
jgi:O-methyltransferase / aklanonic acid methyltransferase